MDYHELTGRQRRILELVASGKTNKEIAAALRISENTVEYHLTKRIYPLLGVRSRSAASAVYFKLVAKALRKSVVDSRASASTMKSLALQRGMRGKVRPTMKYEIDTIKSADELRQVYAFAIAVCGLPTATHTLEYYIEQFKVAPTLLIYVRREGRIIGCTLGSVDDDHVLVGPVAVAESYRNNGVGTAMMRSLEARAKAIGHTTLITGADEAEEPFFLKFGFDAHLFVQMPEPAFLPQLRALNTRYDIAWDARDDHGWSKLLLRTPAIDKQLQEHYEREFPNCATQTVFIKKIALASA